MEVLGLDQRGGEGRGRQGQLCDPVQPMRMEPRSGMKAKPSLRISPQGQK